MTNGQQGGPGAPQLSWTERFRGALLGGAVGDALGTGVRHLESREIQRRFGPGGLGDYVPVYGRPGGSSEVTQLVAFTMDALLRARAANSAPTAQWLPTWFAMVNYLRWLHTQGVPWQYAMSAFLRTEPEPTGWLLNRGELYSTRNPTGQQLPMIGRMATQPPLSGDAVRPVHDRDGNADFAAWVAPVMVWSNRPEAVYAAGASIAHLFTSGPNAVGAAGFHADVLAQLIRGIPLWDAVTATEQHRLGVAYQVNGVPADVRRTVHAAMFVGRSGRRLTPADVDVEFDVEAKPGELGIALAAVGSTRNFVDAVRVAINHSADSCVSGALAGQLAGALYGVGAIPQAWLQQLELRQVVETLCRDAGEAFAPPQWAQRYAPQPAAPARGRQHSTADSQAEQTTVLPLIRPETEAAVGEPPSAAVQAPQSAAPDPAGEVAAPAFPSVPEETPAEITGPIPVPVDGDTALLASGEPTAPQPVVPEPDPHERADQEGDSQPAAPVEDETTAPVREPDEEPAVEEVAPVEEAEGAAPAEEAEPTAPRPSELAEPVEDGVAAAPVSDPGTPEAGAPAAPEEEESEAPQVEAPAEPVAELGPDSAVAEVPEPAAQPTGSDGSGPAAEEVVEPAAQPTDSAEPGLGAAAEHELSGPLPGAVPEPVEPKSTEAEAEEPAPEPDDFEPVSPADADRREDPAEPADAGSEPVLAAELPTEPDGAGLVPQGEPEPVGEQAATPGAPEPLVEQSTADPEPAAEPDGNEPAGQVASAEPASGDDPEPPAEEPGWFTEPALPEPEQTTTAAHGDLGEPGTATEQHVADTALEFPELPEPEASPASVRGGHAKQEDDRRSAPSLPERVLGCFLGGALGDALGMATTAQRGSSDVHDGELSDKTQLSLFTAEGLIRGSMARRLFGAEDPLPQIQLAYQRWLHTQGVPWPSAAGPFRDDFPAPDGWLVGVPELFRSRISDGAARQELARFAEGRPTGTPTEPVNDSAGNGGLVRVAPVALYSADPAEVFQLATRVAALTHGHPDGHLPAGALAVIVQQALLGRGLDDGVWLALQVLETWPGHEGTTTRLKAAVELAERGSPEQAAEVLGTPDTGAGALAAAVCTTLAAGDDLQLALKASADWAADGDAASAVCGNIVGALHGVRALPVDWLAGLELREVVERMALDCLAEFGRGAFRSGQEETDSPDDAEWRDRYPVRAHGTGGAAVHAEETGGAPDAGTAGAGGGEAQEEATQVLPAVDPESVHEFPAPKPAPRRFGTAVPDGPLRDEHR